MTGAQCILRVAMKTDVIDDLKQFISATVSQQILTLVAEMRSEIRRLETKIDTTSTNLMEFIGDTIEKSNAATDKIIDNHERRLKKLESRAA